VPAPIIVSASASSTGSGPTRRTYRRRLADELGEFAALTVSAEASSAVHPDAARQVMVTALASDQVPFDRFDGAYVYVCDGEQAGEVRAVLDGTFDGPIGSLLLDRPFSATLDAGTEVELTKPLPGARHLTIRGLNDLVEEALERIWVEVRLSAVGNGTYEYGLVDYPWIERYEQLRGIYDTVFVGADGVPTLSPYPYRLVTNGQTRTLVTTWAYSSDETFYLDAIVRADRFVYDGTSWAFRSTPGLQADTWQAAAPEEWVLAFGAWRGFEHIIGLLDKDETLSDDRRARLLREPTRRYRKWARAAARIKVYEFARPLQERNPATVIVPTRGRGWT
jgi:hypothetical protein